MVAGVSENESRIRQSSVLSLLKTVVVTQTSHIIKTNRTVRYNQKVGDAEYRGSRRQHHKNHHVYGNDLPRLAINTLSLRYLIHSR